MTARPNYARDRLCVAGKHDLRLPGAVRHYSNRRCVECYRAWDREYKRRLAARGKP